MATITTNTFLDDGTARTAGEVWNMNGGVLTIRTDTRWHIGKPAGTTGSLGNLTISSTLGGGVLVDATAIREVSFTGGTGNIPAIGTTITQGGVSGYLLGVYLNITQAPGAPGTSMPASGFIKFREVTGGSFAAGALTGIGATASGPDKASWLEVVMDQSTAITVPRLGFFRTRGTWYELPQTTNGTANQPIDMPNNGGAAGNPLWPALWIETAPGSNVYESYPSLPAANMIAANLGTDARSKYVCSIASNGTIFIGGNGSVACGFVPPAGCKIRIPNVIGRQTSAANRSFNLVPNTTIANRPDFTTTAAGEIDCEYFINDWYHLFASAFKVRVVHSATMDTHQSSNEASPSYLENFVVGKQLAGAGLVLLNNSLGGDIIDCKFDRLDAASNGHPISLTGCSNYNLTNVFSSVITFARSTGTVFFSQCRNVVINAFKIFNQSFSINTCANFTINNTDFSDRIVGATTTASAINVFNLLTSCDNIFMNGLAFGLNNTIANLHPYGALLSSSNCSNVTMRSMGTFASRIGGATNPPANIFVDSGNNDTFRLQRIYLTATRTNPISTVSSSKNITADHVYGTTGAIQFNSNNTQFRAFRSASSLTTGQSSVYGSHWLDMFTSDTAGQINLRYNEPTASTADQFQDVVSGPGFGFTSAGQLVMPNVNDEAIFTMPYFALGYTALANVAPTITGTNTGNFTLTYRIDTDTGFSGSYKALNATNLSAETISPSAGFRLQIRAVVTVANTGNALTTIRVDAVSTALALQNNLYPLDLATISLAGLRAGSRVQIYDVTNTVELFNQIVAGTSLEYAAPFIGNYTARVRVMYATSTTADAFIEFQDTVTINGLSRTIVPEVDPVYVANAINGFAVTGIVIDDAALLLEINDGTLSWSEIYAYETAWLTTEAGIRDEGRFIAAIDSANYLIEGFKIKNVSSPSVPLVITGGWGRDSVTNETLTLIDTTGGTIFSNPDLVISVAVGSGLSPAQDATLSKLDTLTENVSGLRFTTKALEQAPAGGGGGSLTAADVWSYSPRELTTAFPSVPSAATNAAAVRTELATELARIDVATSTRLATAGYTAPANSDIVAIRAKTDTLVNGPSLAAIEGSTVLAKEATVNTRASQTSVNAIPTNPLLTTDSRLNNLDETISSRLPTASYLAPANFDIGQIKLKTDNLPASPASETTVAARPTLAQIEASTILAKDATVNTRASSAQVAALNNISTTQVRAQVDAGLAAYDAPTKAELDSAIASIPAAPSAAANASAVRSELATELARVDTTISSRNAVAPDNANIAAIKAKVDTLENADLSGVATTAQVADVKKNTDLIPATL